MSTRRQLIKGGIAGLFSAGAASVMATPKDQPQQFDEVYDLVIIGAGGAGLSAGGHAAEDGMKVLILEKMSFPADPPLSAADSGQPQERLSRKLKTSSTAKNSSLKT